jgi:hypothetical protein
MKCTDLVKRDDMLAAVQAYYDEQNAKYAEAWGRSFNLRQPDEDRQEAVTEREHRFGKLITATEIQERLMAVPAVEAHP